MAQVEVIEVPDVPEPEVLEEGEFDPADTHREGVDARVTCECTHGPRDHNGGQCAGADSYGVECECPSYVEMSDGDDDEA